MRIVTTTTRALFCHPITTIILILLNIPTASTFAFATSTTTLDKTYTSSRSGSMLSSTSSSSDIAIVGCGVLGTSICKQILENNKLSSSPPRRITAITNTKTNHESIYNNIFGTSADSAATDNFILKTADDVYEDMNNKHKFKDVIFCAPPSGSTDYPSSVREAVEKLYAGPSSGGTFVFTSTSGVYQKYNREIIDESTPTIDISTATDAPERIARLLKSEQIVLDQKGGCVLRLAGLYNRNRGAHNYYLTSDRDVFPGRSDYLINVLHYDDAASACIAAIDNVPTSASTGNRNIFIISDGNPKTRTEMCTTCTTFAKEYKDCSIPEFEGEDGKDLGKILDGKRSNKILNWEPKYSSFDKYFQDLKEE